MVNLTDALGGVYLYKDQDLRKWAVERALGVKWAEDISRESVLEFAEDVVKFVKGEEDASQD